MKYLPFIFWLLYLNAYTADAKDVLDIKFPDAETGIVFQLSAATPQLTLLSFWQADCESCLDDMAILSNFATHNTDVRMLGVSISDRQLSLYIWKQQKMPFPTLVNNGFPGELLKHFGNTLGAVPYVVLLDSSRQLCWSVLGRITGEQLQQGIAACRMRT